MAGMMKKSNGIPTYIDLDLSAVEVLYDVISNQNWEKYHDISIPCIRWNSETPDLCWLTIDSSDKARLSLWTDDQMKDAGITIEMLKKGVMDVCPTVENHHVVDPNYLYPLVDDLKTLIDAWLMQNHEKMMKVDAVAFLKELGLEGNYPWTFKGWFTHGSVPEDMMRRDAIRMGIDPELDDDWDIALLNRLDKELSASE